MNVLRNWKIVSNTLSLLLNTIYGLLTVSASGRPLPPAPGAVYSGCVLLWGAYNLFGSGHQLRRKAVLT